MNADSHNKSVNGWAVLFCLALLLTGAAAETNIPQQETVLDQFYYAMETYYFPAAESEQELEEDPSVCRCELFLVQEGEIGCEDMLCLCPGAEFVVDRVPAWDASDDTVPLFVVLTNDVQHAVNVTGLAGEDGAVDDRLEPEQIVEAVLSRDAEIGVKVDGLAELEGVAVTGGDLVF